MPDAGASRKRQIPGCRIRQPFNDSRPLIEALKRNLEAEAGRSGHRFVMRASQMRPEYGVAAFGFLSYADRPRGFGLRAFEVRVRRRLSSDFEKAPLDKVQFGRACVMLERRLFQVHIGIGMRA